MLYFICEAYDDVEFATSGSLSKLGLAYLPRTGAQRCIWLPIFMNSLSTSADTFNQNV